MVAIYCNLYHLLWGIAQASITMRVNLLFIVYLGWSTLICFFASYSNQWLPWFLKAGNNWISSGWPLTIKMHIHPVSHQSSSQSQWDQHQWRSYYANVPSLFRRNKHAFKQEMWEEGGHAHPLIHSGRHGLAVCLWRWCNETATLKISHPPPPLAPPLHEMALWSWSRSRVEPSNATPTWSHDAITKTVQREKHHDPRF